MREILFRGKRIDNGEWVEGGYAKIDPSPVCFSEDKGKLGESKDCIVIEAGCADWGLPRQYGMCPVDPSTIGQFTGLMDDTGKRIFEGDIVYCFSGEHIYGCWEAEAEVTVADITDGCCMNIASAGHKEVTGNIHDA